MDGGQIDGILHIAEVSIPCWSWYGTDPDVKVPLIPKSDCERIYEDMLQEVRKRG